MTKAAGVVFLGIWLTHCAGAGPGDLLGSTGEALEAPGGSLSLLSYNIAGLPEPLSGSEPDVNTPLIAPLLAPYELVHVQEDFNYHSELYAGDVHTFRSATSGGVPFGDGLNTLAYRSFSDFERITWDDCNGTDCLTPKGFSYARHRLDEGIYLDLYNVHANAGSASGDLSARRDNVLQLLDYVEAHSAGNAVVVMGDTNTRYTRLGDNVAEFDGHGFSDAWIERVRGGDYPEPGDATLSDCEPEHTSPDCEVVDKIFYRSSRMLSLAVEEYRIEDDVFVRGDGEPLSDHFAVKVQLGYQLGDTFRASDFAGGPHGAPFNDLTVLPEAAAVHRLSIRAGARLDAVGVELDDGRVFRHGGSEGSAREIVLGAGEQLVSAELCSGQRSGNTRVFFASFTSDGGQVLEGGTRTSQCVAFDAPEGFAIAGFYGRSGDEVDKLGLLYARP